MKDTIVRLCVCWVVPLWLASNATIHMCSYTHRAHSPRAKSLRSAYTERVGMIRAPALVVLRSFQAAGIAAIHTVYAIQLYSYAFRWIEEGDDGAKSIHKAKGVVTKGR